ncbi:carotenoid biosynthesis protein [Marivirga lumbricoides]|uniref:carotenoid biosynthesis protein n=1 Tax=Marivirga lumbricoides TaxID=1046115 RepID=UPI001669CEA0
MPANILQKTSIQIKDKPVVGVIILSAFYFFGILGIQTKYADWFIEKTAFNLLLSCIILFVYQKHYNYRLLLAFIFCYLIGFSAEYIGVSTGILFGNYLYPTTLGPQWMDVPIIIGVNWFILTFCVWALLKNLKLYPILTILLSTIVTVLIDTLIEPVAIQLNFWKWENNSIPFQNYIGWALISFIIFSFYSIIKIPTDNKIYKVLLLWQIIFFTVLNML